MAQISIVPGENMGKNFIPPEYLPKGEDEFYQRNKQVAHPEPEWRHLKVDEVERLVKNSNSAENWDNLLVTDEFDTSLIKNTRFFGLVRIGRVRNITLQHHDLRMPAGITNSLIISCDIGDDVAIHNVHYLAHYIIGNQNILFNIEEMHTTDHAKFGNGILKEGEPEDVRIWLDLINEAGGRSILPFDGMITADAYLWAKYVDDQPLQENLKKITQNSFDYRRGYYGTTGKHCVIKNSSILKDVKVGSDCYIKGANKLKNLTINSSEEENTQIGEGVELVNGIIGYGCKIFYGSKAVRFIVGNNSSLKYGARLIHSFLGDNSTISCCEVLNNLIFPTHEQHHNNSFLIASVVMGQSNMAAGATIGSNHNSRANDCELQAGRGFWPGLCTSVKHPSRFASYVLLSKADYPAEMDIPLPFSLLNNNVSKDQLEVMPAFWWMYNMYALARNSSKFQKRDKRKRKVQKIEFDALAPDTAEEIFHARRLLEVWTAKASLKHRNNPPEVKNEDELAKLGQELLSGEGEAIDGLEVLGEQMEKSGRKVLILKPRKAYHAYADMLHYYAVKNLMEYMNSHSKATFSTMSEALTGKRKREWVNLGGQLMQNQDVDQLRSDIGSGKLSTWQDIHNRYEALWNKYPLDKQKHAYATLCALYGTENLTQDQWKAALDKAAELQQYVSDQVYLTRKKDYDNTFRQSTFRNMDEMTAALGTVDENDFIIKVKEETGEFMKQVEKIKHLL
ncbi:MAG: DUF4954 family protein [Bacteroidales bacterium]|nr:DUF4954 family protein [Bacteroidales bacterium]